MEVFFDETGTFGPCASGENELAAVMGLIIPEIDAENFRVAYDNYLKQLPTSCFVDGEPKGRLFSAEQHLEFAKLLNAHPGIMLVPTTFNRNIPSPNFKSWPMHLRARLENEAKKCIHILMRNQVEEVARRCANLNAMQLARLLSYKVGVEAALRAIGLFYHCDKYHDSYIPISITFDRTGVPNNREELVFKEMMFLWVTQNRMATIKQIHSESHPFMKLYRVRHDGKQGLDVSKMIRNNFYFRDSKTCWQLQVADIAASAWVRAVSDRKNTRGFLPIFRMLHRNTSLPNGQPVGLMSVAEVPSKTFASLEFDIFPRLVAEELKILPCRWPMPDL